MAGMYPDNQSINLFGEEITWPGVDPETGKFTNGDFTDLLKKPSFIPAETINLILDNLASLITGLGGTPNNIGTDQIKNVISRAGHPVESYYTQYPVTGQSTLAEMFPAAKSPAVLYGGTWAERFASEDVFFKIAGTSDEAEDSNGNRRGYIWDDTAKAYITAGATPGIQPDAVKDIKGDIGENSACYRANGWSGAFFGQNNFSYIGSAPNNTGSNFRSASFAASRDTPTDATIHPRNRLIKEANSR